MPTCDSKLTYHSHQMLLRNNGVVDAADYDGMTPLHFASRRRGGEGCVAILLNAGVLHSHFKLSSSVLVPHLDSISTYLKL